MNKKGFAVWLCLMLCVSTACAEGSALDLLKPVWLQALESRQSESGAEAKEPTVVSASEELQVLRSAVYMTDEYSSEAYVYAQFRNASQEVLRPENIMLTVYDANGRKLAQKEYASYAPEVILPGQTVYVKEWLYDFVRDITDVDRIAVKAEYSAYSRKKIEQDLPVTAYIEDGYLCAELTNTSQETAYDVSVVAAVSDETGKILDLLHEHTYGSMGVKPGSTIVMRKWLENHAKDAETDDVVFDASGYLYTD